MGLKSIAVIVAAVLLVASVGPAAAADGDLSVAVSQGDDGEATVTVTNNGTGVENASVDVNTTDENATYAGVGSYETDENGTVDLPAPEENVTVEVVAEFDGETAATTAELVVAEDAEEADEFGARVSSFVRELLDGTDDQRQIGRAIASWVTANNPGNAPDHAGPPDDRSPPAVAGNGGDEVGENEIRGQGNVTTDAGEDRPGDGHGPPDNPGSKRNDAARGNGR